MNPTKKLLIRTAEKLFAEHGIDAVSLRQINNAAGQRNASAAHYHFGSKEALIAAIFEERMSGINRRRLGMLEAVERRGRTGDLRCVMEALVWPLAEQLFDRSGGNHYVRFIAQAYSDPMVRFWDLFDGDLAEGARRADDMARAILSDLPERVLRQRMSALRSQLINGIADLEVRAKRRLQSDPNFDPTAQVNNFIDMLCGALRAPVSKETLDQTWSRPDAAA